MSKSEDLDSNGIGAKTSSPAFFQTVWNGLPLLVQHYLKFLYITRLSSFLLSLWSAIRIIAHERPGAIILIALQRLEES
jgi:hypothetical protein